MPKWVEMLPAEHPLKESVLQEIRQFMPAYSYMRDIMEHPIMLSDTYVKKTRTGRNQSGRWQCQMLSGY